MKIEVSRKEKETIIIRSGLTQEPIVEEDLSLVSPLHAIMRCEGNVQKLMYHLRSETFIWTESLEKNWRVYQNIPHSKNRNTYDHL